MGVIEVLSAPVLLQVELFSVHPEGIVQVEVVVEAVKADILGEVGQFLLLVVVHIPPGVVAVNDDSVSFSGMDMGGDVLATLLHLDLVSLVHDFIAEEVVWVDLIRRGEDNSLGIGAVEHGDAQDIDEHLHVEVLAGPACSVVEGFVVLGVVQNLEKGHSLVHVVNICGREDPVLGQQVVLIFLNDLLNLLGLLR